MKNLKYFITIQAVIFSFFINPEFSKSNWIKSGNNSNQNILDTQDNPNSRNDSLPEGVTKDWLNDLRDEKGRKIITNKNTEIYNGTSSRNTESPQDPEGDAMTERLLTGYSALDQFGYSVSSAGDVNSDGYSDIIVGAYLNDAGGANAGRAYIFFGGNIMDNTPDVILTAEAAGDYFGYSVSSAGDVNGDGYSDVVVSAINNDAGGASSGRAYIYFGGNIMDNAADVLLTGESVNDQFGVSVSSAGDVNGDGYSDVVVGSSGNDGGGTNAGRAYIYFGGNIMNNNADVIFTGAAAGDNFGSSVSSAGDVNGDGYGDLLIGAWLNDAGGSAAGRAYIYLGGNSMDNTADIIFTGMATNDYFGRSVSSAGDVNGDGYSDIVVGAYGNDGGRAYIYFGGNIMNNTADVIFEGAATGDNFGSTVSSAGDVNGDGYSDIIVGAYGNDSKGINAGRAYIYFGGIAMDISADVILTGESTNDQFGISVASAGDVNSDGYSDVVVGANFNDAGGTNAGRVYIYRNSITGTDIADEIFTGEAENNYFGNSVSSAGDVNGDGFSDVIVGARLYGENEDLYIGRAYVYFGGNMMDNTADVMFTGEVAVDYFGSSVSSAGDVNGDGYSDIIIGATNYDGVGFNSGRAYIYFGGNTMDNTADVIFTGEAGGDNFGESVSSAGDLNGDGYGDVVVSTIYNEAGGFEAGRAYVYFGGNAMDTIADFIFTGDVSDRLGSSVSSAGDVNGDGYSDLAISAINDDLGGANTGSVYIYYGGNSMDTTADIILTGENTGDNFGYSVSSAGDVNGDGYSDIVIGAWLNDAGGTNAGRAYIYFGGIAMDNTADVLFTGTAAGGFLGYSVSSAGDVNGDGYSDIVAGEYENNAGKAYIYFGGNLMDNTADLIVTGEASSDYFGYSVSSAGDINGDGLGDVVVGSIRNNAGGTYAGRTYLYLSSSPSVKPILNYVKDVPNDQGGKVYMKWARSGYDVQSIGTITDYVVQRSYPPSGGNFAWENISYIPATNELFYSYTSDTPFDSVENSSGTMYFRITARTSVSTQYWRSGILSGRSIDNIAPLMVSPFAAIASGPDVLLNWKRSTAPDLLNYVLFRNVNPTIDPYSETPWATAADSTLTDTSPLAGSYYYFIVAQDIHGNYSPVAVTESPNTGLTLDLTMFIEGFYTAGSNSQVSDTVNVELRNPTSPFTIVDQIKGVVASDGTVQLMFGSAPGGNYYIAVTHRNSIMTWSTNPIIVSGGSNSYNFSTASSQAFGNNMTRIDVSPVSYGFYSGDANQNGVVDLTDVVSVSNGASSFTVGYVPTDMNGDNITDLTDLVITSNNASAFVSAVTP